METTTDAAPSQSQTQSHSSSQPGREAPASASDKDLRWKQFKERNPRLRMLIIIGAVVLAGGACPGVAIFEQL